MDKFWGKVSDAVIDATGMSTQQYRVSLEKQKETIIDFLSFNCYPDEEVNAEIVSLKNKILSIYTKDISQAISKIEVYSHDLSPQIVEAIFQLVQNISCAELTEDIEKKKVCYDNTLYYIYFVKHMVQISLSKLIFDRIKMYKKNLQNFNHKGHHINDVSFDGIIKNKTKKAKKDYKNCLKTYLSYIKVSPEDMAFITYRTIKEDIGLDSLLNQLEEIVTLYEENYHEIVDNGYNLPICVRLLNLAIEIVSVSLLIYGFLDFFGLWDTVFNCILNLF